jgi:hypothetical protein
MKGKQSSKFYNTKEIILKEKSKEKSKSTFLSLIFKVTCHFTLRLPNVPLTSASGQPFCAKECSWKSMNSRSNSIPTFPACVSLGKSLNLSWSHYAYFITDKISSQGWVSRGNEPCWAQCSPHIVSIEDDDPKCRLLSPFLSDSVTGA